MCQHSKHHQWRCDFKCCEGDICWSYSKTSTMIAVHMQYTEQSEARSETKMQDHSNIHLAISNTHLQDSYWSAARGKYLQMKMPFNVVRPSSCKSGFDQYSGQLVKNIHSWSRGNFGLRGSVITPCRFSQLPISTAIKWNVTMMASKPQLGLEPTKCSEDENKYS